MADTPPELPMIEHPRVQPTPKACPLAKRKRERTLISDDLSDDLSLLDFCRIAQRKLDALMATTPAAESYHEEHAAFLKQEADFDRTCRGSIQKRRQAELETSQTDLQAVWEDGQSQCLRALPRTCSREMAPPEKA